MGFRDRAPRPAGDEGTRQVLRGWLERPRYEVMPLAGVVDEVAAALPEPATLTVTVTAARGQAATVQVAERLAAFGHRVVPHLAARQVHDEAEAAQIADRLRAAGIDEAFVIAGDVDTPAGDYAGAVGLVEALGRVAPQLRIGVAGYPESHPKIPDDVAARALWEKRRRASYVVSQLCFDPAVLSGWIGRVRRRGVDLPILAGVAGPVSSTRLLRIGMRVGVGTSMRFLRSQTGLLRLATPGAYAPDGLLTELAAAPPEQRVAGVHLYTFNALAQTEAWRRRLVADLQEGAA